MGARGLLKFLTQMGLLRTSSLKMFAGKRLAWDVLSWVCNSQSDEIEDIYRGYKTEEGSYLRCAFYTLTSLTSLNIKVVPVFDGNKKTSLKKDTYKKRKEARINAAQQSNILSQQLINDSDMKIINSPLSIMDGKERKQIEQKIIAEKKKSISPIYSRLRQLKTFFDLMGVPYIVADGEADIQCVDLCVNDICQGILSSDSDMLIYNYGNNLGNINLITKLDFKNSNTCQMFCKSEVLEKLEVTPVEFTHFAISFGTDYIKQPLLMCKEYHTVIPSCSASTSSVISSMVPVINVNRVNPTCIINYIKQFHTLRQIAQMAIASNYPNLIVNYDESKINRVLNLYSTKPLQNSVDAFNEYKIQEVTPEKADQIIKMLIDVGFKERETRSKLNRFIHDNSPRQVIIIQVPESMLYYQPRKRVFHKYYPRMPYHSKRYSRDTPLSA